MTTDSALSFHLRGNFAPVFDERADEALEVEGAIPPELAGVYVRNGPNPKTGESPHWFFGDGMLHAVRLHGGRALGYRNRWVRTANFEGRVEIPTVRGGASSNTHVVRHAGRVLSLVETAMPIEVTTALETLGTFDFGGALKTAMTAHPKRCAATGELLFFVMRFEAPYVVFYRADAEGNVVHEVGIDVAAPTFMHDFAITERFAILADLPVVMDRAWTRGGAPYSWKPEYGARLGVIPRSGKGADVVWFDVALCQIGHVVNAYDQGDAVVLEAVRAPMLGAPSVLYRWTLNLVTKAVREEALDTRFVEFPRIDDRLSGQRHRFVYASEFMDIEGGIPKKVVARKYDTVKGTSEVHDFGDGRTPGECVFVPSRPDAGEDEGYLLTYVFDGGRGASDLVVLRADDFQGAPVAEVRLPCRVPFGFHGNFFADGRSY